MGVEMRYGSQIETMPSNTKKCDQRQTEEIAARPALGQLQERARELLHAYQRQADRQRDGLVRQPGRVGPEVFQPQAVEREQHQAERADVQQVPAVVGIAQAQPQHQVVDEQRHQDAVVDADGELRIAREFGERRRRVQHQRHLHRTLALDPHQQVDRLSGRQVQHEVGLAIADAARAERQAVAAGLMPDASIRVAQVNVHVVAQRVVLHQQPARLVWVGIVQARVEPERIGLEAEGGPAVRQWLELAGRHPPQRDLHVVVGGRILEIAQVRRQRQLRSLAAQPCRRAGRGQRKQTLHDQQHAGQAHLPVAARVHRASASDLVDLPVASLTAIVAAGGGA